MAILHKAILNEALVALLEGDGGTIVIDEEPTDSGGSAEVAEEAEAVPIPVVIDGTTAELVEQANAQFEAAQAAQQSGDWAEYGRQIDALEETLQQLANQTEE